ncbi:MAG: Zn-ribbon domain-containing OB-fold protein [Myxococcota bacterium]
MSTEPRPLPIRVPESAHFWEGTRIGELRLQRCAECFHTYFPPQPFCPKCASRNVAIVVASGRGTLYSYVISHLPAPGYAPPFSIAVVQLEEGPRMMSNIVDCPQTPDSLLLDMPLSVVFEDRGEFVLPQFRPAKADR